MFTGISIKEWCESRKMDMFSPPATPKSSTLASAVPRSKSFGDLSQLTSGNSSISSRSSTSFSPVPASPRPPKPNLSLTLPIPSTLSTADTVVFKNDQIFKIKSHEAYLAPAHLTSHLSFRKGQAFYALNHNDQTKCFFVSTEYATPFSPHSRQWICS
ncbi:hypothetical protein BDR26DRAFT_678048 [Obelidium mucronatum]|nr:hypothetical protein BDR26DRAFT_678048 [Obelidium mucronatum]